jgi:hypothetical protein
MKIMKELEGEEGQAKGKCIGMMQSFTMEMEDILLLPQVHLGHIVVGAFYLKLGLHSLRPIYFLFDANHLGRTWTESLLKALVWRA